MVHAQIEAQTRGVNNPCASQMMTDRPKTKRIPRAIVSESDPRLERMDKRTKEYRAIMHRLQAEPMRNRAPAFMAEGKRKPRDNANRVHWVPPGAEQATRMALGMPESGYDRNKEHNAHMVDAIAQAPREEPQPLIGRASDEWRRIRAGQSEPIVNEEIDDMGHLATLREQVTIAREDNDEMQHVKAELALAESSVEELRRELADSERKRYELEHVLNIIRVTVR